MLHKIGLYTDELTFWQASVPDMSDSSEAIPVSSQSNPALAVMSEDQHQLASVVPSSRLKKRLSIQTAQSLEYKDLLRVHTTDYLHRLEDLTKVGGGIAGPDASLKPDSFKIARLSAGLVSTAFEAVMGGDVRAAYAFCRSPGHHCLPDQAMHSCFLANIPLAIETVRHKLGDFRVAVVDWGAHHGNGTQTIYEARNDVLTISIHQEDSMLMHSSGVNTRGIGKAFGTNINVPLPAWSGHETYMRTFERVVLPSLDLFKPDAIIVSCGFDAHATDTTSQMLLHSETFRLMTRPLRCVADELCNGKLLFANETAFQKPYVQFCSMAVIEELVSLTEEVVDPSLSRIQSQQPGAQQQNVQNRWVDLLAGYFGC